MKSEIRRQRFGIQYILFNLISQIPPLFSSQKLPKISKEFRKLHIYTGIRHPDKSDNQYKTVLKESEIYMTSGKQASSNCLLN